MNSLPSPADRSSGIAAILDSIPFPVRVHGATQGAQALIALRSAERLQNTLVILCPNDEKAEALRSDLEALSVISAGKPIPLMHFPTWEQSPFSSIAPSIRTRHSRVATLSSLVSESAPESPRILITTIAASCQATLPPELFKEFSIRLSVGESVGSRELLGLKLIEAGYLRVDTVEDPGSYGVRGDIVDIFPPDQPSPLRVELFGDQIERLRAFDPETQRTLPSSEIKEAFIPASREVLINPKTSGLLRERVKERADDLGILRPVRDPVLSAIQNRIFQDHTDAWAPFAYRSSATLWNYLPSSARVLWVDELSCTQEWEAFMADQERRSEEATRSGLILPEPKKLFPWDPERARRASAIFLDQVQLADWKEGAESPAEHRVVVRANSDLAQPSRHSLGDLEEQLRAWLQQGFQIALFSSTHSQLERMRFLLEERKLACAVGGVLKPSTLSLYEGDLSEGFRWPAEGLVVLTEKEILGTSRDSARSRSKGKKKSASKDWAGLQTLSDLSPGDAIVHIDHGVARYQGLARLDFSGAPSDFLVLEYANKDKLYLPVYRLNVIQKYAGAGESAALDRLGSAQFSKTKEKVRESVRKLAIDLIQIYAQRKIRSGIRFSSRDAMFQEFEAKFPFEETPDQLKAIDDVLSDLESGRMMDRLVCGDVGYGKTEVAIRAAFRAVSDGKQVAVLVPTTVLAFQHEQSFRARLKDYPITIESASRFKSAREQRAVIEGVVTGKVDIVIGTHRLLSQDVRFKDLGLVIIDEEHRFGVEHKEKLKTIKINTHVLTLTATPIPRTLHMALSGLRDISLINTPPVDRLPIRTYVSRYDESLVQRAISFELNRGGQVFFLHNRVQNIEKIAERIRALVPNARVSVGHGQMSEGALEETMLSFYQKKSDVLVSTTIIESGLDVPSANTILINRADSLGLAQLYQIRGRVGRGQERAYAYLLIPAEGPITDDAKRRLDVIQRFVELGSGFHIASHDLEIRGGGEILGPQQSGQIAAVGFDLYMELLDEAIQDLQGTSQGSSESKREPEIKVPFPAFLSEQYIPDIHQRLSLYRRFSSATLDSEIDQLEEELKDRFGPLPEESQNLLWLIRVKQLLQTTGMDTLTVGPEKISLSPGTQSQLDPVRVIAWVAAHPGRVQLTPDSKLIAKIPSPSFRDSYFGLEGLLRELGGLKER